MSRKWTHYFPYKRDILTRNKAVIYYLPRWTYHLLYIDLTLTAYSNNKYQREDGVCYWGVFVQSWLEAVNPWGSFQPRNIALILSKVNTTPSQRHSLNVWMCATKWDSRGDTNIRLVCYLNDEKLYNCTMVHNLNGIWIPNPYLNYFYYHNNWS